MIPYPSVITHKKAKKEVGTPLIIKELTLKYLSPFLSVSEIAVTFGNPEDANPIPQEANSAQPKTNTGAAFGELSLSPTSCTSGIIIMADTVCETKVPTTSIKIPKIHNIAKSPSPSILDSSDLAIVFNKPEAETAPPKAIPPMANITIDHGKVFRSLVDSKPVPKNKTIGKAAIIPEEPNAPSIWDSTHHKRMVPIDTKITKYCFRVNAVLMGTNFSSFVL